MGKSSGARPVAINGTGFSSTMAAPHLLPRLGDGWIVLCEWGEHFARGLGLRE